MTTPSRLIFLDANVPMYAGGREHPLRGPCAEVMLLVVADPLTFVTDAEVLQEIIHRYRATGRWSIGEVVLSTFSTAMSGRVEPIFADDAIAAAALVLPYPRLSARDLLHVAVMRRIGATYIVSADQDFEVVDGLTRLDPADVATWRAMVERDIEAG